MTERTRYHVYESPVKTEESDELLSEVDSECDSISGYTKKITKKRKKYSKIEDDIRMKLLDAVENHGETLKSAATKFGVNYSSAKSIFHTYRKEGRILKKPARERYRRKPLIPRTESTTITQESSPGVEAPKETKKPNEDENHLMLQMQQLQTMALIVKTIQQNNILNQLQAIHNLLTKESQKEPVKSEAPQILIPKVNHPNQPNRPESPIDLFQMLLAKVQSNLC